MLYKGFTFLVRYQLWISLAAVLFYRTGRSFRGLSPWTGPGAIEIVIFFSAYLIYNLPRIYKSIKSISENRLFIFSILFSFFMLLAGTLLLQWYEILYLVHLALISFYYNYPFRRKNSGFLPLRSIPLIKIGAISYVWACIGSMFYLFNNPGQINAASYLQLFFTQFLFIFTITIPFDIRDYSADRGNRILTLPLVLGVERSKLLAYILGAVFILTGSLGFGDPIPFLIMGIIIFPLVYFSGKNRHDVYYTGLIDGSIIIYWCLLAILPSYAGNGF